MMDSSALLSPISKSWVAARYTTVDNNGVCKRKCKYMNCGKEYSRGTSHMTLKKHWSKQHSEQFVNQTTPKGRNKSVSTHMPSHLINQERQPQNRGDIPTKRTRESNYSEKVCSPNKSKSTDKDILQDVKLVSRRLKEASSIHISFDLHEAKKGGKVFGIITAHSVSDNGLKSVVLEYKHLHSPDDKQILYECLRSCIAKFNIREKIISISSGYSESMLAAVTDIDKKLKISKNFNYSTCVIRCFAQFIHSNVNEIFCANEIMIDYIRSVIGLINQKYISIEQVVQNDRTDVDPNNPQAKNDNESLLAKSISLTLIQDNRSSWNTTFEMIENFLQYRTAIQASILFFKTNPQFISHLPDYELDWAKLDRLYAFLQPIHEIMKKFASENYISIAVVLKFTNLLLEYITQQQYPEANSPPIKNLKHRLEMYKDFFICDLTIVAALLDPRIKDSFFSISEKHKAYDILHDRTSSIVVKNERPPYCFSVNSIFNSIFEPNHEDEILHYINSPRKYEKTDIFAYWESQKYVLPKLYVLARSILCLQASSVTSEKIFCAADIMIRERSTQVDSSESKELIKSWAKYLEKD